eukprot:365347-Chlamydomonas_euryale.AAC.24
MGDNSGGFRLWALSMLPEANLFAAVTALLTCVRICQHGRRRRAHRAALAPATFCGVLPGASARAAVRGHVRLRVADAGVTVHAVAANGGQAHVRSCMGIGVHVHAVAVNGCRVSVSNCMDSGVSVHAVAAERVQAHVRSCTHAGVHVHAVAAKASAQLHGRR